MAETARIFENIGKIKLDLTKYPGEDFYCDGEVVTTADQYVSQIPQFILLSTEVMGYRLGCPLKIGEEFIPNANKKTKNDEKRVTGEGFVDDAFVVDYVRVFDEVE